VALLIAADRPKKVDLPKEGPIGIAEVELAVGTLPEHEARQAHLATGPILRPRPSSTYVDMRVHDSYQAARRVRHGDVGRPNTLRSAIFARSSRRLSDEDSDRPERLMYRLSIDMAD
jgi:hypothetical protein